MDKGGNTDTTNNNPDQIYNKHRHSNHKTANTLKNLGRINIFIHPVTTHTPIRLLTHTHTQIIKNKNISCWSFLSMDPKKAQFCHAAINELMF